MIKNLVLVAALILLVVPRLSQAQTLMPNSNVWNPRILNGPLVVCTGTATPARTLSNGTVIPAIPACSNICNLFAQIANVIYYMIAVIIWIIAPVMAVVGGIMIMLGGTSPEMVGRGKKTITGAVWGIVIALSGWLIVKTFVSPVDGIGISGIGGFSSSSAVSAGPPTCNL